MSKILICDVDNCISDDSHRMGWMPERARFHSLCTTKRPKVVGERLERELRPLTDDDFHDYHLRCVFDLPAHLDWVENHDGPVWFVTAMPRHYVLLRDWWINNHLPGLTDYRIIPRPDGDHRCSTELKPALIRHQFVMGFADPSDIRIAIDDRQDVLDAYAAQFDFPTQRVWIND